MFEMGMLMAAAIAAVPEKPVTCAPDGRARSAANEQGQAHWCEAPSYFGGWSKDGEFRQWDPAGTLRVEGSYFSGRKDGKWTFYDAEGDRLEERRYRNGKLLSRERIAERSPSPPTASGAGSAAGARASNPSNPAPPESPSRAETERPRRFERSNPTWLLSAVGPGKATTLGVGGRMALFLPMLDLTLRTGITDGFTFNLRGATVGLVNAVDLSLEGRLFRTRDASLSLLAGGTFTGVFAFGNESISVGPTPGFRLSFGGPRFQFTAGMDVPMYVFTSISSQVVSSIAQDLGTEGVTASATGLWVTVRPMLGVEFPVGRRKKTQMYVMAQLEQSVVEESGGASLSYTLPFLTVGANWDLTGGGRSKDRYDF